MSEPITTYEIQVDALGFPAGTVFLERPGAAEVHWMCTLPASDFIRLRAVLGKRLVCIDAPRARRLTVQRGGAA